MMNTQIKLDIEEVRKFVGDSTKFLKDLEEWTNNAVQIENWKDHFLKEYPKIFNDSSENEVEMDIDTTKPAIDRDRGGALPYKPLQDVPFVRVSFFSINS